MTEEELMAGLEPIEERYKPAEYTSQETKSLYKIFGHMTFDNWEHLCGRVLALDFYRIPSETIFTKVYNEHRSKYKKYTKIRIPCDDCRGYGVSRWVCQPSGASGTWEYSNKAPRSI